MLIRIWNWIFELHTQKYAEMAKKLVDVIAVPIYELIDHPNERDDVGESQINGFHPVKVMVAHQTLIFGHPVTLGGSNNLCIQNFILIHT